jgi:arylsulfatase A-like enzyme
MRKNCNRRDFLKSVGLGTASLIMQGCLNSSEEVGKQASRKRPNIIFIMTDDHASHALSCYGSKINQTPNLDRLAGEGMLFENCFCTNSICAPSRAAILTGKYSHINGVTDNVTAFDGSQQTFPKLLQKAGYRTALIGKWHLESEPTGFDYWNILPGQGVYYNPDFIEMGKPGKYEGYVTDIITDLCLDWLKNRRPDKPFCLLYHHKAPHRHWEPGPEHLTTYEDLDIPEPKTLFDAHRTRTEAAKSYTCTISDELVAKDVKLTPPEHLSEEQMKKWNAAYQSRKAEFEKVKQDKHALIRWKYQCFIKDYLRCIASVDDNVGRMLDYLDESGLADNTIVVYTSDQGFFLGDHGWFDKRLMYEQSLRMPFLVRYPKHIKPGSVCERIALNIDFAPTFLDFAGAAVPSDMQGRSLRPILEGKTPEDWRRSMYYHYYEYPAWCFAKRHYGVRTDRYKLIHFYYDIDAWELYDLKNDPEELNNVYGDARYADIVADLKSELGRLQKQYGDSDELAQKILKEHPQGDMPYKF